MTDGYACITWEVDERCEGVCGVFRDSSNACSGEEDSEMVDNESEGPVGVVGWGGSDVVGESTPNDN